MSSFMSAKTLLALYKRLPTAVCHIDNEVSKIIKNSFYYNQNSSTLEQCNRIIELNSLKADYLNVKMLVDKATSFMLKTDKRILQLRFIKKLTFRKMADECGRSLRQTFRCFDGAVEAFGNELERLGFDENKIVETFGHLPLFEAEFEKEKDAKEQPNAF